LALINNTWNKFPITTLTMVLIFTISTIFIIHQVNSKRLLNKKIMRENEKIDKNIRMQYETTLSMIGFGDKTPMFSFEDVFQQRLYNHSFLNKVTIVLFLTNQLSKKTLSTLTYLKHFNRKNSKYDLKVWCISPCSSDTLKKFVVANNFNNFNFISDEDESFRLIWGVNCPCSAFIIVDSKGYIVFSTFGIPNRVLQTQILTQYLQGEIKTNRR